MLKTLRSLPKDAVVAHIDSPVGVLSIIASSHRLHAVLWPTDLRDESCKAILKNLRVSEKHSIITETKKQLTEYFSKKRKKFDLPIILDGTDFQKKVWKQLVKIPYGQTISYGEQAKRIGDPKKARAVGIANSKNPVSIIVPCHRVIGKNGELTGFGGGLTNKKFLIDLERCEFP